MARIKANDRNVKSSAGPRRQLAIKAARKGLKQNKERTVKVVVGKRKHRFRPGTVSLFKMRKYQRSTDELIRKKPLKEVIQTISNDIKGHDHTGEWRFRERALHVIRQACEADAVKLLKDVGIISIHSGMKQITKKDLALVIALRANHGTYA